MHLNITHKSMTKKLFHSNTFPNAYQTTYEKKIHPKLAFASHRFVIISKEYMKMHSFDSSNYF